MLTVSIVISVYRKTLRLNNLKTRPAMNVKISVFVTLNAETVARRKCRAHLMLRKNLRDLRDIFYNATFSFSSLRDFK